MIDTSQKSVGDIVAGYPAAARVFEKYQIDFCCNGKRSFDDVCAEKGIDRAALVWELDAAAGRAAGTTRDWSAAPAGELIGHIVMTHHAYLRSELPWIAEKIGLLVEKHAAAHPWLVPLAGVYGSLAEELEGHLHKEEMVLFPYILRMEESRAAGRQPAPPPFGSVRNPINVMEREHDSAGEALREMRRLSSGYTTPPGGCTTFRATMGALARLEADLHTHIHLENNILHPRAIAMQ